MRANVFLAVGLSVAVAGAIVGCEDSAEPPSRRNVGTGSDGGGDDGRAQLAKELFTALEPELQTACGKQCHASATYPGQPPPFLAPPDPYASIKSFPALIVKDVFQSRLLVKGAHAGPALDGANEPLRKKVVAWLDVEADLLRDKTIVSTPTAPITIGHNTLDLGALAPNIAGARIEFDARAATGFLSLENMTVRGADASAVHIAHPLFRLVMPSAAEKPDPVDSFSNLDDKVASGATKPLGAGQLFLFQWADGDKLRISFEVLEATTIPNGPPPGPTPCKALQEFTDRARPQLENNGCLDCHGDGAPNQGAFDLGAIGTDDAIACTEARRRIDFTNKPNSLILQKPAGPIGHTGGKVGDPTGFTDEMNAWISLE